MRGDEVLVPRQSSGHLASPCLFCIRILRPHFPSFLPSHAVVRQSAWGGIQGGRSHGVGWKKRWKVVGRLFPRRGTWPGIGWKAGLLSGITQWMEGAREDVDDGEVVMVVTATLVQWLGACREGSPNSALQCTIVSLPSTPYHTYHESMTTTTPHYQRPLSWHL